MHVFPESSRQRTTNGLTINIHDKDETNKTDGSETSTLINLTNAVDGCYCYLTTMLWIFSSHFISDSTAFGKWYYFLLLCFTMYIFLFNQNINGIYKSLGEPKGHFVFREIIYFWTFFKDFFLMFWVIIIESIIVYIASYINPNKFNPDEMVLEDSLRMAFNYLFNASSNPSYYKRLWFRTWCQGYIPGSAFTFVLWAVLLMIGQAIAPQVSGFILGKKYCRAIAITRVIRWMCFLSTIIPSSYKYNGISDLYHRSCHQMRMTDYPVLEKVPEGWRTNLNDKNSKYRFWDEPMPWKYFSTNHGGGGCNDLIFSGHCSIIFVTLCLYYELYVIYKRYFDKLKVDCIGNEDDINIDDININNINSNGRSSSSSNRTVWSQARKSIQWLLFAMKLSVLYIAWLALLSSIKMVTEGHHYSVDVIVAWFVTVSVYYICGSLNTATRDSTITNNKKYTTVNPWWVINVSRFPSYVQWYNNTSNIQNYNWVSRQISKFKFDTTTIHNKGKKGRNDKRRGFNKFKSPGFYLLCILALPMLGAFGLLLRVA